jgi:glycerophosphoryl diester phosphodiesterase
VLLALSLFACDPEGLGRPNPSFHVIGHRGAPNLAAENTIPSYEVAISLGANAIELDVCLTADDVLVVWHDRDPDGPIALARQSGAEGLLYLPAVPPVGSAWRRPVRQLTLAELRSQYGYAELGAARDEIARIPTLAETLDWARGEERLVGLYVDLKVTHSEVAPVVELMSELAGDGTLAHVRVLFFSLDASIVSELETERQRLGFEWPRVTQDHETPGALSATIRDGLRDVMMGLSPSLTYSGFKRDVADAVERREKGDVDSVTVWTFDRETQLAELLYYSVDGVMTNEPARLHRMWRDTLD